MNKLNAIHIIKNEEMSDHRHSKELSCPLCKEKVYSETGKGCKMCGMPLEYKTADFCSETCRNKYIDINKNG